jgi:hypothetical protein
MAPYIYRTLPPGTPTIRLLALTPGAFSDPLHVTIFHTTLSEVDEPGYEALSYVWGSADNLITVRASDSVCDGTLQATRNLEVALRHLRLEDGPRTLWIDAICIDQRNAAERGHQVGIMGEIYTLARRVIAWLGPEDRDSSMALDAIQRVSTNIFLDWDKKAIIIRNTSDLKPDQLRNVHWLPFDNATLGAIYRLIMMNLFERLWIRQEIGLAAERAVIRCGPKEIDWLEFCATMAFLWVSPYCIRCLDEADRILFGQRIDLVDLVISSSAGRVPLFQSP